MSNDAEKKDKIFRIIQNYLKHHPVIIWGSGATIPLGMPSMEKLKKHLDINKKGNLEEILSKTTHDNGKKYNEYKKKIFGYINKCDMKLRKKIENDQSILNPIKAIIQYCYNAHPNNVNIITTNYDCVLEYCLSINGYNYTDGFSGKEFAKFDESNFKKKDCINLLKVHGSIRWCKNYYSYFNKDMMAILPTRNKYEEAYQEPFRTLIKESDDTISGAESIFSIGFGFNDEHLAPKINQAIEEGSKIVIVAKEATDSIKQKIRTANKFVLIEQEKSRETKFSFKERDTIETITLEGKFWKLSEFIKILT